MTLPLTLYGASDCDDTEHVRNLLNAWGVLYREVNIDLDGEAERFVIVINRGYRSTPTLVLGDGKFKQLLTEPTDEELEQWLAQAGHTIAGGDQ